MGVLSVKAINSYSDCSMSLREFTDCPQSTVANIKRRKEKMKK